MSLSFFHSVEFYVILAVVAAAIIALATKPASRGPVSEYLLAGDLLPESDSGTGTPTVEMRCLDDGRVLLIRHGLSDIHVSGACSLAVTVKGFDLQIEERLTPGSDYDDPVTTAMFSLDFLVRGEYYHIRYNSSQTGRFSAFTFHVRPGIVSDHPLVL